MVTRERACTEPAALCTSVAPQPLQRQLSLTHLENWVTCRGAGHRLHRTQRLQGLQWVAGV